MNVRYRRLNVSWTRALLASLFLSAGFVVLGGISSQYSFPNVVLLAMSGALLGAIAVPHLKPNVFRHPSRWQMVFAVLGSAVLAVKLQAGPVGYAVALVVSVLFGLNARRWTGGIGLD